MKGSDLMKQESLPKDTSYNVDNIKMAKTSGTLTGTLAANTGIPLCDIPSGISQSNILGVNVNCYGYTLVPSIYNNKVYVNNTLSTTIDFSTGRTANVVLFYT